MTQLRWFFEDFQQGQVIEVGKVSVSEEEIMAFARSYDPQPFHIDREAAERSHGGVIASGWHTGSLMMRLMAENLLNHSSGLPSPGLDELRWLKPVRGGDTLSVRGVVLDSRVSASKPDRGIIKMSWEARNQHDELVTSAKVVCMFRLRDASV